MTIASSNFTIMRYGEYADPTDLTTLPTAIREIPMTGESLGYQTQSVSSQNINSSRQILDTIQTGYEVSGGVQIEMAPYIWDHLIQGALWANWQTTPIALDDAVVSIDADAREITFAAETPFDATGATANKIKEGQFIQIRVGTSNSIAAGNTGIFQIEEVTSTSVAVVKAVDGATPFSGDETSKNCCVRASMIRAPKDGSSTNMKRHVFLFEKEQSDLSTPTFTYFKGCYVNNFSLNAQSSSLLTGSFDFMGSESAIATSTAVATHTAAMSFNGFNAVNHVGDVIINGKNLNGSTNEQFIQGLDFTVTNNLRGIKAIGHLANIDTAAGMLGVTGNLNVFFKNTEMYNLFVNQTEFGVSYSLINNATNEGYVISFPRVTISNDSMSAGGQDQDIVENMQFTAMYDNTDQGGTYSSSGYQTSIQIDRFYDSYARSDEITGEPFT